MTSRLAPVNRLEASPRVFAPPASRPQTAPRESLRDAINLAREHLFSLQRPDGHWCAELEGDTILESEFVLLQAFLGRMRDPRIAGCAKYLLAKQESHGGWSNYPGGPADISATVKAYFALKIAGHSPEEEPLRRARELIREMGGAETVNSFTRFYLASLGQLPYSHCPSVPPELVLLPRWFPVSLWKMSAWTRSIVVPLAIVQAYKPVSPLPRCLGIEELFQTPPSAGQIPRAAQFEGRWLSWPNFFRFIDRCIKTCEYWAPLSTRTRAIKAAERWMIDRFEGSDGLGAIFPPMVYTVMALKCLGYAEDSAEMKWAEKQLDDLILREGDAIRLQPCFSPIWDTALSIIALADSGCDAEDPRLLEAADWLLDREIRRNGDWTVMNPRLEPSGWAFEYNNAFYPDLDDTAMVLLALCRTKRAHDERGRQAIERAVAFLKGMRCRDGGWGAFDRDINNPVLEAIPFADHNAMLDPSCPDITARVLELFGHLGISRNDPIADDAIAFLFRRQEPEGCWYGRWGVNYIYGAWQTLLGLKAIGYDMRHPRVIKAAGWLKSVQQADGGWGETCASYDDRSLMGQGKTTASQTAWAVMGLIAADEGGSTAVERGIRYLLDRQNDDGSWDEDGFTGTGFPRVFYLKYHYYRLYFPLLALARYEAWLAGNAESNGRH